jgi:hypothetical protein
MKYYIVSLLLLLVLAACGPAAQMPRPRQTPANRRVPHPPLTRLW